MLAGFPDSNLSFFITRVISLFVMVDPPGNLAVQLVLAGMKAAFPSLG